MENPLVTFNFNQFPVRIQTHENGDVFFCLKDVCDVLELKDFRTERLDSKGVIQNHTPTSGGIQSLNFINEPNLYRVIFRSDKPEAQTFQDWVFEEVLPTIRKTGSYSIAQQAKCKQHDLAHVYCIENAFGLVKFGIANKPFKRFTAIEANSGVKITKHHFSPLSFNAHEIEKSLFAQFADQRQAGEWFSISFENAVDALNQHFAQLSIPNDALNQLIVSTVERVLESKQLLLKPQPQEKKRLPVIDEWQPLIEAYLAQFDENARFSLHEIANQCLGIQHLHRRDEMRIAKILKQALGYSKTHISLPSKKRKHVYCKHPRNLQVVGGVQ